MLIQLIRVRTRFTPPRVRMNNLGMPAFRLAFSFLTHPRYTWAWQGQQARAQHTGGQTFPLLRVFFVAL